MGHKTGFTRRHPQGYSRLSSNLQSVGNLIYNYKLELKRFPSQTAQISEPHQGGNASLKFVMLRFAEEVKLGYQKESSSILLIRSHKGGVTKPFENQITCDDERDNKKQLPVPPIDPTRL